MKNDTWYDREALVSKLITYAAIFILVGSFVWSLYILHIDWGNLDHAVSITLCGVAAAAFLVGLSAIIDLLIVNAEAMRAAKS